MRTIKFRGKRIDNGEWVYGYFVGTTDSVAIIIPFEKVNYDVGYIGDSECCYCFPETIGLFTGLYDKNGNEIYEGDIIGCHNPSIKHLIFYNEKQGRFMAALNGDIENDFVGVCGLDDSRWNASKEVIGNIHDNPELLKGGNK